MGKQRPKNEFYYAPSEFPDGSALENKKRKDEFYYAPSEFPDSSALENKKRKDEIYYAPSEFTSDGVPINQPVASPVVPPPVTRMSNIQQPKTSILEGIWKGFTSPIIKAYNEVSLGGRELGQGLHRGIRNPTGDLNKQLSGVIDILGGGLQSVMLPFTALFGAATGGLKESTPLDKKVAKGLEQTMNLPFEAIKQASELVKKGFDTIGLPLPEDNDVSKKINNLITEVGGLLLMGKGHREAMKYIDKVLPEIKQVKPLEMPKEVAPEVKPTKQTKVETPEVKQPNDIKQTLNVGDIGLDKLTDLNPEVKAPEVKTPEAKPLETPKEVAPEVKPVTPETKSEIDKMFGETTVELKNVENNTFYHGTSKESAEKLTSGNRSGLKRDKIFISPFKDYAEQFGKTIVEMTPNKELKVANGWKVNNIYFRKEHNIKNDAELYQYLKKEGYDAVALDNDKIEIINYDAFNIKGQPPKSEAKPLETPKEVAPEVKPVTPETKIKKETTEWQDRGFYEVKNTGKGTQIRRGYEVSVNVKGLTKEQQKNTRIAPTENYMGGIRTKVHGKTPEQAIARAKELYGEKAIISKPKYYEEEVGGVGGKIMTMEEAFPNRFEKGTEKPAETTPTVETPEVKPIEQPTTNEVQNATQKGKIPENNIEQRLQTDKGGLPPETGSSNSILQSGKEEKVNQGTGETKVRGLSKTTEIKAIESDIVEGIKNLPDYEVLKNDPQIKTASNMIANDFERAKRIALGQEEAPSDLLPGFVYKGLESYAIKNKDINLIKELATSSYLSEQATRAGQFVQSLRGQDPYSPVKAVKDIIETQNKTPRAKKLTELEQQIKTLEDKIKNLESDRALKKAQREIRKEKRSYTKEQLKTERSDLYAQLYQETANLNAGVPLSGKAVKIMGQLLKNYAEEGITNAAEIVDAIYTEVSDKIKGITKEDIRNALSGYGKEVTKTRDELTKQVADLRKQMVLISKIEDLQSGKLPQKRTINKTTPSEELQALKEQLKNELKNLGITEQETLSKSKTAIRNRIKEIDDKINRGEFTKPTKKLPPTDIEKQRLEAELKDKRDRWNNIQKYLGEAITDKEIKQIVDLSKNIEDTKIKVENSIRSELNEPKTPEEMAWGLAQRYFNKYIANLKHRAGKITLDDFKSSPIKTTGEILKASLNASKSMVSAFDDSFIGRQGLRALFTSDVPDFITAIPRRILSNTRFETNPEIPRYIWSKSLGKSLSIIGNTLKGKGVEIMDVLAAEQLADKYYPIMQKMKVALSTAEEAFPTDIQFIDKVPLVGKGYRASEYAFTGTAHYMRYKLAQKYIAIMKATGVDLTDKVQLEAVGQMINSLTARGNTGGSQKPGLVNAIIWSPKMIMGHINVLTDPLIGKTSFVRKQAGYNLLKIMGGIVSIQAIANAVKPGSAETNPLSSDWGKIKVGNTTFDYTGGLGGIVTLAARLSPLLIGKPPMYKDRATGEIKEINTGEYGSMNGMDLLYNFLENKTSPFAGEVVAHLKGETRDKQRPTVPKSLMNMYVPFPAKTGNELLSDPNSANFIASMILDSFGFSSNTYSNDPDLIKVKNTLLRADKEKMYGKSVASFNLSLEKALENGSITKEQYDEYIKQFEELQQKAPEKQPKGEK